MKKFLIKVSGEQFEVEVEEVMNGFNAPSQTTATKPAASPGIKTKIDMPVSSKSSKGAKIDSPMPGSILKISVNVGDEVKKGQTVFVLEAMKMENEIASPVSGKIAEIKANAGDPVSAGQTIIIIE